VQIDLHFRDRRFNQIKSLGRILFKIRSEEDNIRKNKSLIADQIQSSHRREKNTSRSAAIALSCRETETVCPQLSARPATGIALLSFQSIRSGDRQAAACSPTPGAIEACSSRAFLSLSLGSLADWLIYSSRSHPRPRLGAIPMPRSTTDGLRGRALHLTPFLAFFFS
jgi:hypothetical protein